MSHFYAKISNSARKNAPTARGHKTTGVDVEACGWGGKVVTILRHVDGVDVFEVWMQSHMGEGESFMICEGVVGKRRSVEFNPLGIYRGLTNEELLRQLKRESDPQEGKQ